MGTLAIVLFFVGLLIVILIHELGHYLTARAFGFKVLEMFVGFGPRLWSFRRGEVEYGVKALPLGAYVKIAGMNPYEKVAAEDLPRSYGAKPRWQRAIVIVSGPATHFVLGAFLFAGSFMLFGDPSSTVPVVGELQGINGHASPAKVAGLQPGDEIVSIGDVSNPTPQQLVQYTTAHAGDSVSFRIDRGGEVFSVTITPEIATVRDGRKIGRIGIVLGLEKRPLVPALGRGVMEVGRSVGESVSQIGRVFGPHGISRVVSLLFTNAPRQRSDAGSVVALGQQVGIIGDAGQWGYLLRLLGFVTVFVGLINLVPLPPFDGGHLAVLAIEKLRGRAIDMRRLIPLSATVMGFLVLFVMANVILDIAKPIPGP